MASDILVCSNSKCGDRVLAIVAKEKGWEKCPLCGGKYAEEAEEKPKSKK